MEEGGKMEEAAEVEEMKEAGNGREMCERRSCQSSSSTRPRWLRDEQRDDVLRLFVQVPKE